MLGSAATGNSGWKGPDRPPTRRDHQQRGRDRPIDKGVRKCSCGWVPVGVLSSFFPCRPVAGSQQRPAVSVLPVDDDLFIGLGGRIDQRIPAVADRATSLAIISFVWIDEEAGGTGLALLYHRLWNGQAVVPRIDQQTCVDELARPVSRRRLVGKVGLELDRAGGLQDLAVDEAELALNCAGPSS